MLVSPLTCPRIRGLGILRPLPPPPATMISAPTRNGTRQTTQERPDRNQKKRRQQISPRRRSRPIYSHPSTTPCRRVDLNILDATGNVSKSRHDKDHDSETTKSGDDSHYDYDPGTVLDAENEGDAEILRTRASRTSNLTGELDQLKPGQSSDGSPIAGGPEDQDPSPARLLATPEGSSLDQIEYSETKKTDVVVHHQKGEKSKTCGKSIANDTEKEERVEKGEDKSDNRDDDMDSQHQAWDDCERRCQQHDESSYLSVDSGPSSPYAGGMAGLDPHHSAEWVPSFIDVNESKSKKRRRRHKQTLSKAKNSDSLGKLLSGKQSKADEELISTFDIGNQIYQRKRSKIQEDTEILGGNLGASGGGHVQDCQDHGSFAATLNSTKHGPDFGWDDDSEMLREGSENDNDMIQEDSVENVLEDAVPAGDDKEDPKDANENDSLSSNSTGTKRKRKRNKKTKPTKPDPAPEATGRATRSKTQPRVQDAPEARDASKKESDNKGEKEKPPRSGAVNDVCDQQEADVAGTSSDRRILPFGKADPVPPGQVSLFKQPKIMTRTDLQRLVSKAVQKSKSRTSNNFSFNSKIQRFQVVTKSDDVPKFPEINPLDPLREISIPEFIWPDLDKTMKGMVNVKSRGVVQFVILARSGHVAHEAWDTPPLDLVRDFASFLLCKIAELKLEYGTILRWTNPWGNVAVMGLDTSDLDTLQKFRTFFTTLRFSHHYFNTFPKDALTSSLSLSILLRSELQEFKEEYLAEALFARNKLFGVLETLEAETYTAADTTRAGVSKNGWRNVLLEGDEAFLQSLSDFPAHYWFNIGPASVQIHGGDRRAETYEEIEAKNKRKRFNMPIGQSLSTAAKTSINQSFLDEQKALMLKKKREEMKKGIAKKAAPAPAPSPPQPSGTLCPQTSKKK